MIRMQVLGIRTNSNFIAAQSSYDTLAQTIKEKEKKKKDTPVQKKQKPMFSTQLSKFEGGTCNWSNWSCQTCILEEVTTTYSLCLKGVFQE